MNVNKAIKESARNVKNSNEVAEVNFQKWRESKDCFIIYEFLISFLVHFKTTGVIYSTMSKWTTETFS